MRVYKISSECGIFIGLLSSPTVRNANTFRYLWFEQHDLFLEDIFWYHFWLYFTPLNPRKVGKWPCRFCTYKITHISLLMQNEDEQVVKKFQVFAKSSCSLANGPKLVFFHHRFTEEQESEHKKGLIILQTHISCYRLQRRISWFLIYKNSV